MATLITEAEMERAVELRKTIRSLDFWLLHLECAHTIKVEVWASVDTGNFPVTIKAAESADTIRDLMIAEITALMRRRCDELKAIGFEAPQPRSRPDSSVIPPATASHDPNQTEAAST